MKNESGINPCLHYILVLPDEVEKKTASGIYLANETIDNKQRDTTKGTLIAVGPLGWSEFQGAGPQAKVGDRVVFGKYAGRDMKGADDKRYILANCEDILAVLD